MCLGPSPPSDTFDSPAITRGTSSVFYSAVNTLFDVDTGTVGDEHMEYEDIDSNYSSFDSVLGSQAAYNITPLSALNRSFSLPPHRYGVIKILLSLRLCKCIIIWIMYFESLRHTEYLYSYRKSIDVIVCFGYVCGTVYLHSLLESFILRHSFILNYTHVYM